jgi:hypothetical protein
LGRTRLIDGAIELVLDREQVQEVYDEIDRLIDENDQRTAAAAV